MGYKPTSYDDALAHTREAPTGPRTGGVLRAAPAVGPRALRPCPLPDRLLRSLRQRVGPKGGVLIGRLNQCISSYKESKHTCHHLKCDHYVLQA